jgi:uncharacterized NAD(P)/FAD-binding protein YdhS
MFNLTKVAIVGGGASGTLTAIQLMKKLTVPATIYLFEKNPKLLYRGAAYSSELEYEPLNVHAGKMSAFNHLPDHFFQWVRRHRDASVHRESFVSRRWYGDYLSDLFSQTIARSAGIEVKTLPEELVYIETNSAPGKYQLHTLTGEILECDFVIFCTGNEAPQHIFSEEQKQLAGERYCANPWHNSLDGTKPDEHILIVGTGLTMVDYAGSLYQRRHAGKIYCFSRNGYLPLSHADEAPFLFDEGFEKRSLREIFSDVRKAVALAEKRDSNWQAVMDALRPCVSRIWRGLSFEEKALFLKKFRSWWEIHRHRMPENSYKIIKQMMKEGQLELISGSFLELTSATPFLSFRYKTKQNGTERTILLNRIINCTGSSGDYIQCNNRLIKNLIASGQMKQDALKIGIETGIRGEIIGYNGVVQKNWFAVGPMRKASEWESTAIREIRTHAEGVAEFISDLVNSSSDVLTVI